jgi:hypothetical protein
MCVHVHMHLSPFTCPLYSNTRWLIFMKLCINTVSSLGTCKKWQNCAKYFGLLNHYNFRHVIYMVTCCRHVCKFVWNIMSCFVTVWWFPNYEILGKWLRFKLKCTMTSFISWTVCCREDTWSHNIQLWIRFLIVGFWSKMKMLLFICRYLQECCKKLQKEAEQDVQDSSDPACPPGHVLLPESERTETLTILWKSRKVKQKSHYRGIAWGT